MFRPWRLMGPVRAFAYTLLLRDYTQQKSPREKQGHYGADHRATASRVRESGPVITGYKPAMPGALPALR